MKESINFVILAAITAFVVGTFLALGYKTMNKTWPDPPRQIEITPKG